MLKMRKQISRIATYIVICLATLNSCKKENFQPNAFAVPNRIDEATTWKSDLVYIINEPTQINAPLTIEPGTIIKFGEEGRLDILWDDGIVAVGSKLEPIIFTSFKDDIKGDSNGDNDKSIAQAGDWDRITHFGVFNKSVFKFCEFKYGGITGNGVLTLSGDVNIQNCVFSHNLSSESAEYIGALDLRYAKKPSIVKNNTFYDNTIPLCIYPEISIDNSNQFSSPDGQQTNKFNGIFVTGHLASNTIWQETEVAYVIYENGFGIFDGNLSLSNDVVLKFMDGIQMDVYFGEIINHNSQGVYFTSYKDDTHKGDTNADGGNNHTPFGVWKGIYNGISNSFFEWPNILNANNSFKQH